MLAPLREVADEILVAVDDRIPLAELAPLRAIADAVHMMSYPGTNNPLRAQLFAYVTTSWILALDADEVVSRDLLVALPKLVEADDIVQYRIARRWLFPDATRWLDETPWWPDFQFRLIRREFAVVAGTRPHDGLLAREPARFILEPIYHLDCLLYDRAAREKKANRYEAASPARVPYGGGPFNRTFYVPELHATRPPAPTPPDDVESIEAVLNADSRDRETLFADKAQAASRAYALDDYDVEIELIERDTRFAPGETRPLVVAVHNRGPAVFHGEDRQPPVRLAYRLHDRDGRLLVADGVRTPLPAVLASHASEIIPVEVQAPARTGDYVIDIDLVHEGVRWFECALTVKIVVGERASNPGIARHSG
jgi:hypothetical protein